MYRHHDSCSVTNVVELFILTARECRAVSQCAEGSLGGASRMVLPQSYRIFAARLEARRDRHNVQFHIRADR